MESNKNKQLLWKIPFLLFLIVGTIYIIRQQRSTPYQHDTGFIFGTVYNVTYQSDQNLKSEIEAEMKKVDASLSTFNKQSTISRINRGESPDLKEDGMFREVFTLAEEISAETGGAFDITVAPLVNAWGFGFKKEISPNKSQIDSLMQFVGYQKVKLATEGNTVRIKKAKPNIMLDCSAIAKGYGSDVVARFLRRKGILNYMIEIGGEVVTSGISAKRVPWKIGVTKPVDDSLNQDQGIQTIINITDRAMATSGNYRNFYYKGGKKYAHTIDPRTGYPVQHNILSATVLAKECAIADAYATSFMVLGLDGARKILDRHPELMAYFIYSDAKGQTNVWYSQSMRGKILE